MIDDQIRDAVRRFLADDYGAASFAEWVGQRLGVELHAKDFKGVDFEAAVEDARHQAEVQLTETVREAVEENLPADAEPVGMDLAVAGDLGQHPLRPEPQGKRPQAVRQVRPRRVRARPRRARRVPRREGRRDQQARSTWSRPASSSSEDWGRNSLAGWLHHKFGIAVDPAGWAGLSKAEVTRQALALARDALRPEGGRVPRPRGDDPLPPRADPDAAGRVTTAKGSPPGPPTGSIPSSIPRS